MFSQCSPKVYSISNLPSKYIQIGSYGGFTGSVETFFFFPNGQRFLALSSPTSDIPESSNEIEGSSKKEFQSMLNTLEEIDFYKIDMMEIGNMTYFIRVKTEKLDKSVQWGDNSTIPKSLESFYQNALKDIDKAAIN